MVLLNADDASYCCVEDMMNAPAAVVAEVRAAEDVDPGGILTVVVTRVVATLDKGMCDVDVKLLICPCICV